MFTTNIEYHFQRYETKVIEHIKAIRILWSWQIYVIWIKSELLIPLYEITRIFWNKTICSTVIKRLKLFL